MIAMQSRRQPPPPASAPGAPAMRVVPGQVPPVWATATWGRNRPGASGCSGVSRPGRIRTTVETARGHETRETARRGTACRLRTGARWRTTRCAPHARGESTTSRRPVTSLGCCPGRNSDCSGCGGAALNRERAAEGVHGGGGGAPSWACGRGTKVGSRFVRPAGGRPGYARCCGPNTRAWCSQAAGRSGDKEAMQGSHEAREGV